MAGSGRTFLGVFFCGVLHFCSDFLDLGGEDKFTGSRGGSTDGVYCTEGGPGVNRLLGVTWVMAGIFFIGVIELSGVIGCGSDSTADCFNGVARLRGAIWGSSVCLWRLRLTGAFSIRSTGAFSTRSTGTVFILLLCSIDLDMVTLLTDTVEQGSSGYDRVSSKHNFCFAGDFSNGWPPC